MTLVTSAVAPRTSTELPDDRRNQDLNGRLRANRAHSHAKRPGPDWMKMVLGHRVRLRVQHRRLDRLHLDRDRHTWQQSPTLITRLDDEPTDRKRLSHV